MSRRMWSGKVAPDQAVSSDLDKDVEEPIRSKRFRESAGKERGEGVDLETNPVAIEKKPLASVTDLGSEDAIIPAIRPSNVGEEEHEKGADSHRGIWHWLSEAARLHSNKVGSIDVDVAANGQVVESNIYSYAQIHARATTIASFMFSRQMGRHSRIGVFSGNCHNIIEVH